MSVSQVSQIAQGSQGPVQVVKKAQDQLEREGQQAVALIQAAGSVAAPASADGQVGSIVSTVV